MWSKAAELFNPYREIGAHINMEKEKRSKRRKCKIGSQVYVLYTYWNTPNTEGSEVLGVFLNLSDAILAMKTAAESLKAQYPSDYVVYHILHAKSIGGLLQHEKNCLVRGV